MPRVPRRIVPGFPHHITQRGTNRQSVFYTKQDRRVYLELLRGNSGQANVRILAYCLMLNHIHLVAVPEELDSLAICLRRTHGRYAQYLNVRCLRCGHLWQNRFYSCPMDNEHLWTALRYVELNPVRAGLTEKAEDFAWPIRAPSPRVCQQAGPRAERAATASRRSARPARPYCRRQASLTNSPTLDFCLRASAANCSYRSGGKRMVVFLVSSISVSISGYHLGSRQESIRHGSHSVNGHQLPVISTEFTKRRIHPARVVLARHHPNILPLGKARLAVQHQRLSADDQIMTLRSGENAQQIVEIRVR